MTLKVELRTAATVEELAELVAHRVVELLDERDRNHDHEPAGLVDAATLARLFGVSRSTVYEHSQQLGAIEIGDGNGGRPRLRFDVERARAAWPPRISGEGSEAPEPPTQTRAPRRRRPAAAQHGDGLLPIKGEEAA